ncbi:zinc-binding alcohol dehydrogenase family protein (plasmid) [Agrobacterium pusense]|uniref:quinone oxidoreductase family protein n=1 Tax=Agrobacterium pusense TaxID=648995 RepID=UPI0010BF25ED|nr:zinc-binding alcohol dehydrogenase family protein [Agrobacterium pusense]QCL87576.1 zinc-binding alcohol dehydrogenase family protein [Agrobacterium pusense]
MIAAVVSALGQSPTLAEFPIPTPGPGERLIRVSAAAISHLTKAQASGSHFTADTKFPHGVGMDGVGRLDDGSLVYFAMPRAPHGSMAEHTVVDTRLCVPVPDGLDASTAAAIANPGMSSWVALTERARLKVGETVLINGATGTSGRLAVKIARLLGARRVVATGRNARALAELTSLGADVTIRLDGNIDDLQRRFIEEFAEGVDVVLDYLWGQSAENLLIAAARVCRDAVPIRFVQIGSISAADITLPGGLLRASAIEITGSGGGSVALPRLIAATEEVLRAAASGSLTMTFKPAPFCRFDEAWPLDNGTCRTVFTMNSVGA